MRTIHSSFSVMIVCAGVAQGACAADAVIDRSGHSFAPADVTIDAGDKVTWTNIGSAHNVAQSDSASSNSYDLTGFRSGDVGDVNTFEFIFNTPGIFYYICEPHAASDDMKGSVTVQAAGLPAASPTSLALSIAILAGAVIFVLHRFSSGAVRAS